MSNDEAYAELSKLRNHCIDKPRREHRRPNDAELRLFDALQIALRALEEARSHP